MMRLKDLNILNPHPMLEAVADYVERVYRLQVITSGYRPGDPGVHGTTPLRGLDLRCRSLPTGKMIEEDVNGKWEYDPERPAMGVAWCHDTGQGLHLHFQVHPRTRWRNRTVTK